VLTGFNTDIEHDGVVYHVQTEDRGASNPLIESLVYVKGEILANRRTEYRNLIEAGGDANLIRALMERQHRAIVDAIRAGRIDLLTAPPVGLEGDTTATRRLPDELLPISSADLEAAKRAQKTLDEVIGDWLAEQQRTDRIKLVVQGGDGLKFGQTFALQVRVCTSPGDRPVSGAHVMARFLSTERKPLPLAEGESDGTGEISLAGEVPDQERGTGLVVVSVHHESTGDEVKFLVKR
jgi:hypothetical protein